MDGFERLMVAWSLVTMVSIVTFVATEDTVMSPTCETCKLPDLPWYLDAWCWLNC